MALIGLVVVAGAAGGVAEVEGAGPEPTRGQNALRHGTADDSGSPVAGGLCADVDCSFLDDACAEGVCDSKTGLCVQVTDTFAGIPCIEAMNDCEVEVLCDGDNAFCPGFADCEPAGEPCDGGAGLCNGLCDCIALEGACCIPDGSCEPLTEVDCSSLGGYYYGNFTNCSPNPDPPCEATDAVITCVPGEITASPGSSVELEFLVSGVPVLSGYQVTIAPYVDGEPVDGQSGFDLDCSSCTGLPNADGCGVRIDEDRDDWVFRNQNPISAPSCESNAGGSVLIFGSVTVPDDQPEYLVEFTVDIASNVTDGSVVEVRIDQTNFSSFLNDNIGQFIPFFGDSCYITIEGSGFDRDLNGDGNVDLADYGLLSNCFNGAGNAPSSDCANGVDADFDGDGDVDEDDYVILYDGLEGPQ